MTTARARVQTTRSGVERTNREATAPPHYIEGFEFFIMVAEGKRKNFNIQFFFKIKIREMSVKQKEKKMCSKEEK